MVFCHFILDIVCLLFLFFFFFFKQKTAYEMRISDWSSDVCSSDLRRLVFARAGRTWCCSPSGILWERLQPRALDVAPPPAKAGGGWEGVPTVRADPEDTPPQPVRPSSIARWRSSGREPMARKRPSSPPAFAGEGADHCHGMPSVSGKP